MRASSMMLFNSVLSEKIPLQFIPGLVNVVGYYFTSSNRFLAIDCIQDEKRMLCLYQLHLTHTTECLLFSQNIAIPTEHQSRDTLFFQEEHDLIQIPIHHSSKDPSFIPLQKLKDGALMPIELCTLDQITALKQIIDKDIESNAIVDSNYLMTVCETEGIFQKTESSCCCHVL